MEYKIFRPKAHEFRATYLGRIADELVLEDGVSAETHFRNLMQQEDTKNKFKHIKQEEKQGYGGGVSAVEKDISGTRVRLETKIEIEEEISRVNRDRLQQANNTPLRAAPLQALLGEQMDFETWEVILTGSVTLPTEGIEEGTRLWFEYVTSQTVRPDITISWTPKEYFEGWKKMKEGKGSAPGIYFLSHEVYSSRVARS